jgi:hypothetical protein
MNLCPQALGIKYCPNISRKCVELGYDYSHLTVANISSLKYMKKYIKKATPIQAINSVFKMKKW